MTDKRDQIEDIAKWTSLEKDSVAIYADDIKTYSTGVIEFGKIVVQSLIYINAGALTIAPAILKLFLGAGPIGDSYHFFIAIAMFTVGLVSALLCAYAAYVQYNFDWAEQVGYRESRIEFYKTSKEVYEKLSFLKFDDDRYKELVNFSRVHRRKSRVCSLVVQMSGWFSAVSFCIGSVFAAFQILALGIPR